MATINNSATPFNLGQPTVSLLDLFVPGSTGIFAIINQLLSSNSFASLLCMVGVLLYFAKHVSSYVWDLVEGYMSVLFFLILASVLPDSQQLQHFRCLIPMKRTICLSLGFPLRVLLITPVLSAFALAGDNSMPPILKPRKSLLASRLGMGRTSSFIGAIYAGFALYRRTLVTARKSFFRSRALADHQGS
jgi:hypothetical protein